MYKSDFLLKQLEDLATLIARMISLRKELQLEKAEKLLEEAYVGLSLDKTMVLETDFMKETGLDSKTTFFRLQLVAKILVETYFVMGKDVRYLQKAKELLSFVQENGLTFSFEVVEELKEIEILFLKNNEKEDKSSNC